MPPHHRIKSWSIRPLSTLWLLCACVNEDALPGLAAGGSHEGTQQATVPATNQPGVSSATTPGDTKAPAALTQAHFDTQLDDQIGVVTAGLGGLEAKTDLNIHLSCRTLVLQENQRQEAERKQREDAQQAQERSEAQQAFQKKAQKRLRDHYKAKHAYIHPFFEEDPPWPIQQSYVQLDMIVWQKVADIEKKKEHKDKAQQQEAETKQRLHRHKTKRNIQLAALFDKLTQENKADTQAHEAVRRVVIEGYAGTGKTTLCRKLAHLWAQGQWCHDKFEAVYVLPVRKLQQEQYDGKSLRGQARLETAIVTECFNGPSLSDEAFEQYVAYVKTQLSERSDKVLLILDGLDEQRGASSAIIQQAKEGGGSAYRLWTSRPHATAAERVILKNEAHTRLVACNGFSGEQVVEYVCRYFKVSEAKQTESSQRAASLLRLLQTHPTLHDFAQVPITLQILCKLWKEDPDIVNKIEQGSITDLYTALNDYLWEHYVDKKLNTHKPTPAARKQLYTILGDIALKALQEGKYDISRTTLRNTLRKYPDMNSSRMEKLLRGSGLLRTTTQGRQEFLHLSFQEYFAGRALAQPFMSEDKKASQAFLDAHKYTGRYRNTLLFMAGIVCKQQGQVGLEQFLEALESPANKEVVGLQHLLLQLRCINECIGLADIKLPPLDNAYQLYKRLHDWVKKSLEERRRRVPDDTLTRVLQHAFPKLRHIVRDSDLSKHYVNALEKGDSNVKLVSFDALKELAKAASPQCAPSIIKAIVQVMERALKRQRMADFESGAEALTALVTTPEQAMEMFERLWRMYKNNHYAQRTHLDKYVTQALLKFVSKVSTDELQKALIGIFKSSDHLYSLDITMLSDTQVREWLPKTNRNNDEKDIPHFILASARESRQLLKWRKEREDDLRALALRMLWVLYQARQSEVVHEVLLEACQDISPKVREEAIMLLYTTIGHVEQPTETYFRIFKNAYNSTSSSAERAHGLYGLFELARADSKRYGPRVLQRLLSHICSQRDDYVFSSPSARELLVALAKDIPTEETLHVLLDASGQVPQIPAKDAIEALVSVAPTQVHLHILLEAYKSGRISGVALCALLKLVEVTSEEGILPALCKAYSETALSAAIVKVFSKGVVAKPQWAPQVLHTILDEEGEDTEVASIATSEEDEDAGEASIPTSDASYEYPRIHLLGNILAVAHQCAPKVFEELLRVYEQAETDLRKAILTTFARGNRQAQAHGQAAHNTILAACQAPEEDIRAVAMTTLGQWAFNAQTYDKGIHETLLKAVQDPRSYVVRRAAIASLGTLVGVDATYQKETVQLLCQAAEDWHDDVRVAALSVLGMQRKVEDEKVAAAILHTLLDACKGNHKERQAVTSSLQQLAQTMSPAGMFNILHRERKNIHPAVRKAATIALGALGKAHADYKEKVVVCLIAMCADNIICSAASTALVDLAPEDHSLKVLFSVLKQHQRLGQNPDTSELILALGSATSLENKLRALADFCKRKGRLGDTATAVLEVISRLSQNEGPKVGIQILGDLLKHCEHSRYSLWPETLSTLVGLANTPADPSAVLEPLLETCMANEGRYPSSVARVLNRCSTRQIIEAYCCVDAPTCQHMLPYLQSRLYGNALVIQGCQLILHESAEKPTTWTMLPGQIALLKSSLCPTHPEQTPAPEAHHPQAERAASATEESVVQAPPQDEKAVEATPPTLPPATGSTSQPPPSNPIQEEHDANLPLHNQSRNSSTDCKVCLIQ